MSRYEDFAFTRDALGYELKELVPFAPPLCAADAEAHAAALRQESAQRTARIARADAAGDEASRADPLFQKAALKALGEAIRTLSIAGHRDASIRLRGIRREIFGEQWA